MSQFQHDNTTTDGTATVVLVGIDATNILQAGHGFGINETGITSYQIASAPTYAAGDTTVVLTTPYTGADGTGQLGLFQIDYTSPSNFPVASRETLELASLMGRFAVKVQEAMDNLDPANPYAQEWADNAEDVLVSAAAGGNQVDDYSALHWAAKSEAYSELGILAQQFAINPEDDQVDTPSTAEAWAGTADYILDDDAIPTTPNEYYYVVTVAGTSGISEPTWPTVHDEAVVDGTVTWKCVERYSALHWAAKAEADVVLTNADVVSTAADAVSTDADATICTTKAAESAASAIAAQDAADSVIWNDVAFVTFADSPITIAQADEGKLWVCDTSSGDITFTCPLISGLALPFTAGIKKSTSDVNSVIINANASDEIDGGASRSISTAGTVLTLLPDIDSTPDSWTIIESVSESVVGYATEWAINPEDVLISVAAGGNGTTDYSALHWAAKAEADAIATAADVVSTGLDVIATNADVIFTNADVVSTNADAVQTALDVISTGNDATATAADLVATNQDTIDTAADLVATNQDTIDTAADVVSTNADVISTGNDATATAADLVATNQDTIDTAADLVATNQDTIDTAADAVSTDADATTCTTKAAEAAASALAAQVAELDWVPGGWVTATGYTHTTPRQVLEHNGSSYVCILSHTSDSTSEPGIGASWATYWEILAAKGDAGEGSGDMLAATYDPTSIAGDAFARENHIGVQVAATVSDFEDAVGSTTELTGILTYDDVVSINTDITKIDIIAFDYFIQGAKYSYAGGTALVPTIAGGDSSTFVGVDSAGVLYSSSLFSDEQTKTILPLARLQAVQGQSGPGSQLQTPVHLTYSISQDGFVDRRWTRHVIGALYGTGGTFSENGTTPLQVDQTSGIFHNAQRKHIDITGSSNIEVSELYHIAGVPTVQTRATLVIPKYYDDGTDIVALGNNKFVSHTLLRSPKAEDLFIFVYGNTEYASQAAAEQAPIDYSVFVSQAVSGMMAVARFIVKGDSTNIITIVDERPSIGGTQSAIIGTATLQQVYDNSTTPELLTDTVRGALSIKRGSAEDTDSVLEVLNGAGTTTFSVDGNGLIVADMVNTPAGNISATTTQDAINELDTEKEPADATILKDADIGVSLQAYSATNALLANITYGQLDTNGDVGTSAGQLAIGDHTHTGVYEPADATLMKESEDADLLGSGAATNTQVLTADGASGASWQDAAKGFALTSVKTAAYTAISGDLIPADTATTGAFTITLPITPSAGDSIKIYDYAGNFGTATLTIGRNGSLIGGTAADMTVTTDLAHFTLTYIDATKGWQVTES